MNRLPFSAGFAGALVVALCSCGEKNTFAPPPPAEVTVQPPLIRDQEIFADFPGNIEAKQVVEVRARVRGFLEKIAFKPGGKVEQGALLFEIEDTPYVASMEAADAAIKKAEADARIAQNKLDRLKQVKQGAVAEIEIDAAEADLDAANAAVLAAKADFKKAENDVTYCSIHAEMSGRISETEVDIGNVVGNNEATLLATIVQDDEMHVYFEVNERSLLPILGAADDPDLEKPENFRIILADGNEYEHRAIPDFNDVRLDPDTGTMRVRAVLPNPDKKLVDGLFCRVGIPFTLKSATLVPAASLQQDLAGYFVMTVGPENKVVRKNVEVGRRVTVDNQQMRVVNKGLDGSEKIIVGGLQRAREGAAVNPSDAEAPAPTPPPAEGSSPEPAPAPEPTAE